MRRELKRLVRLIAPPMAATPIELRSELSPDEFERALERLPEVFEHGPAHIENYRARWATVAISGDFAHIRLWSGAFRRPGGGMGGTTLYFIEARLAGSIVATTAGGSVWSAGLRALNGFQDAVMRPLPSIIVAATVATAVAAAIAPSLVLVPGVVAWGASFGFAVVIISLRLGWKQRSNEIAEMLLIVTEATASTITDPPAQPKRGFVSRFFGPWLRDIPASAILEGIRRAMEPRNGNGPAEWVRRKPTR
jgi:hypothetical protein